MYLMISYYRKYLSFDFTTYYYNEMIIDKYYHTWTYMVRLSALSLITIHKLTDYLNRKVESDYTVVFFTAGGRHTPGWNWIWKAYRSLSRKYRKNLKKLASVYHFLLFKRPC
jgi:hypothetical protein